MEIKYNLAMENTQISKIDLIKKAFELKSLKRYKEAIDCIKSVLAYQDNSIDDKVEMHAQLADILLSLNESANALEELKKVLKLNKAHTFALQKTFDIYMSDEKYDLAMNIAQTMCELSPNAYSYINYFNVLTKTERNKDAVEIFNNLNEDIKFEPEILYLIASVCDKDKKRIMLKKVVELDETHLKANLELAKLEYDDKRYNKVVDYCTNIIEENSLAYYYLALVEYKRSNYLKAIELFKQAIKIDNNEHDFDMDLAKAYIEVSCFTQALELIKKSISKSLILNDKTKLDEKFFLAGWVLIKLKENSKALLNLDSIEKTSPYYDKAQILIETINLKNSNISKAKIKLEKYLSKERNNPILFECLAEIYKDLKIYDKAVYLYKKALEIYPESIYYVLEIIDLLIDKKNYDEALKLINDFKEKYENCPSLYNSLARIYYRLKDYNKALENMQKCISLDSNTAESYYFKGLILNDLERHEEALEEIYTSIKYNPNCAKYYNQMARAYMGINELEDALLYSKEAIELKPEEIMFKKMAYEIALKIGDKSRVAIFEKQLKQSERILKLSR